RQGGGSGRMVNPPGQTEMGAPRGGWPLSETRREPRAHGGAGTPAGSTASEYRREGGTGRTSPPVATRVPCRGMARKGLRRPLLRITIPGAWKIYANPEEFSTQRDGKERRLASPPGRRRPKPARGEPGRWAKQAGGAGRWASGHAGSQTSPE